jgi:3-oxoacyl-[acyl-carrier protein] reductase
VATELAALGADVFIQHYSPHDTAMPWGSDDLELVRSGVRESLVGDAVFGDLSVDLSLPDSPSTLVEVAAGLTGRLDILVCNQAKSGDDGSIFDMTADSLDAHWQVNARATILMTRAFAERSGRGAAIVGAGDTPPAARPGELPTASDPQDEFDAPRVFWMTSGQVLGAMPGEVAYVASKAALAGLTRTAAKELLRRGIILNTINPGPVNTGYLDPESTDRPLERILDEIRATPFGRFGMPADPARLIGWLSTDAGRWVVGQVLTSDGGFSL